MLRAVSASGQLVAPRIRAVTNRNAGVVEAVRVLPGDRVAADDALIVMSSPEVEEELAQARWDLAAAEAEEAPAGARRPSAWRWAPARNRSGAMCCCRG